MSADAEDPPMESGNGSGIVHRELDTGTDRPAAEIARIVAELEERSIDDLSPTWECIDDVLAHVFSNPPSPDAKIQIGFDYEGYRIIVEQNGGVTFVDTS